MLQNLATLFRHACTKTVCLRAGPQRLATEGSMAKWCSFCPFCFRKRKVVHFAISEAKLVKYVLLSSCFAWLAQVAMLYSRCQCFIPCILDCLYRSCCFFLSR